MKQESLSVKKTSSLASVSIPAFPLEVINLLNVLARIEARRQEKLRESRKEVA